MELNIQQVRQNREQNRNKQQMQIHTNIVQASALTRTHLYIPKKKKNVVGNNEQTDVLNIAKFSQNFRRKQKKVRFFPKCFRKNGICACHHSLHGKFRTDWEKIVQFSLINVRRRLVITYPLIRATCKCYIKIWVTDRIQLIAAVFSIWMTSTGCCCWCVFFFVRM